MTPVVRGLMEFGMGKAARDPDPSVFGLAHERDGGTARDRQAVLEDKDFKRHFVSRLEGARGVEARELRGKRGFLGI
jgi:hypothetical protein